MTGMVTRERMDIERLVHWALSEQGLGWANDANGESWADYGTRIHSGSIASPSISLLTDDDALIVKAAIDGLTREARELVLVFGRSGLRPDGADEPDPVPEQIRNKRGQLVWEYAEIAGRRHDRQREEDRRGPMLDMAKYSREKELIDFSRAQWALWWEALRALIGPLNNRLQTHYATGPEASREPWCRAKPRIILPDGTMVADVGARTMGDDTPRALDLVGEDEVEERQMPAWERRVAAQADVLELPTDTGLPVNPIRRHLSRAARKAREQAANRAKAASEVVDNRGTR